MNFNIKQALIFGTLASLSIPILTSCDSGDSNSPQNPDSTAPSEEAVIAGDRIIYNTNSLDTTASLPSLTFDGNDTTLNGIDYTYSKTGDFTFELRTSSTDSSASLLTAYATLVNGTSEPDPNGDDSLASRFRELLRRAPGSTYQPSELREIITALRSVGPSDLQLLLTEDQTGLIIPTDQIRSHVVTTSIIDRNRGSMGGGYVLRSNGTTVLFRARQEGDPQFRFSDGLLVLDPTGSLSADSRPEGVVREIGTFSIQFINPPSFN